MQLDRFESTLAQSMKVMCYQNLIHRLYQQLLISSINFFSTAINSLQVECNGWTVWYLSHPVRLKQYIRYKFTANHSFTGLIAFIKRSFYTCSKVSQNKTEKTKCNDINKNNILPPNNLVLQKQLWFQQSGCRAKHKYKQRCMFIE